MRRRFEDFGRDTSDIDESTSFFRQALELRPRPHPDRLQSLNSLVSALKTRSQHIGNIGDLDKGISCIRQTLELQPLQHLDRSESPITLADLAEALFVRFQHRGGMSDPEEILSLEASFGTSTSA